MSGILTVKNIKAFMNTLILIILIMGISIIISKSYVLLFQPSEIDIVRLDVPWNNPMPAVTVMYDKQTLQQEPDLLRSVNFKIYLFDLLHRIIFIPLLLLILIELKKLLIAVRSGTFFNEKNFKIVKHLSSIVGLWVILNFVLYQMLPFFISEDIIAESINFISIKESLLSNIIIALDAKMLFVAIMLFVISEAFKEGYILKEQTDLTI